MDLIGKVFGNRYWITEKIATGGMAEVYKATDKVLSREVALKILNPTYSENSDFIARFKREAKAAANLTHPNIVAVHDWGEEDGTYFIVMEYVKGKNLKEIINESGPLQVEWAIDITRQVLSALSFAHRKNVIHRDIKPHNILITDDGLVKVTDFGIAQVKLLGEREKEIMGTAYYISPEQVQGLPATEASDIYSLGVVFYEMLTGKVPFTGSTPSQIASKHLKEEPIPPHEVNFNVPPEVGVIALKAMAKNPLDRFQNADEMKEALEKISAGFTQTMEAVEAEKTMVLPQAMPQRQRRARIFWIALFLTLFLLLSVGAIGGFLLWQRSLFANKVEVPSVVGMEIDAAKRVLQKKELKLVVEKREFSREVPPNHIISQDPPPGTKIKKGSEVKVVVSRGVEKVEVPDVVGLDEVEAASLLGELGLKAVVKERIYSEEYEESEVTSQTPAPGVKIPKGSEVYLIVSKGIELVIVPDVINLSQSEAISALKKAGLKYTIKKKESETIPEGSVISQNPAPGIEVRKWTRVELTVSSGPPKVTVPDVVGMDELTAQNTLDNLGFLVESKTTTSTPDNAGLVVSQSPEAGTEAPKGSTVTIWVGVLP
jgi:serine/threonine-protein kinase